jgi:predicted PurR-regulated permease PerM
MREHAARNRLALVALALALLLGTLVAARGALFPFFLSGIIAYLLFPAIKLVETRVLVYKRWPGAKRTIAVVIVYAASIAAVAGLLAAIVPESFRQGSRFVDAVPDLISEAREQIERWSGEYGDRVPRDIRDRIESTIGSATSVMIGAFTTIATKTLGGVLNVVSVVIGFAIVPFFVFYILKDRDEIFDGLYGTLPPAGRRHAENVIGIINNVLGAYVRAQLTLVAFVAMVVFAGLWLIGVPYALLLGIIAGLAELIPIVGPLLGMLPGILVTLATSPADVFWVLALYIGIQTVQNAFITPRVQGRAVKLHPALIMIVIVVASEAAGLWGIVLAVPLVAAARDVFRYFYREWSNADEVQPAALSSDSDPADAAPPGETAS